jgi:hypothetical protein
MEAKAMRRAFPGNIAPFCGYARRVEGEAPEITIPSPLQKGDRAGFFGLSAGILIPHV